MAELWRSQGYLQRGYYSGSWNNRGKFTAKILFYATTLLHFSKAGSGLAALSIMMQMLLVIWSVAVSLLASCRRQFSVWTGRT